MRKDPLAILEAAYRFDVDEALWLRGIVRAARPYDLGGGILAYVTQPTQHVQIRSVYQEGTPYDAELVATPSQTLPPSTPICAPRCGSWGFDRAPS